MYNDSNVSQDDQPMVVQFNVRITEALKKRVEHAAIDRGLTPKELVTEALERFLEAPEARASGDKSAPGGPGARQSSKHIEGEVKGR